jgi:phosphoadenosine phosphosulfate reductase
MSASSARLPTGLDAADPLATVMAFARQTPGRIVFTTSFGVEDQALTHMIATSDLSTSDLAIDIVTLDTGRLFVETHAVWAATEQRYGRKISAIHPDADALATLVARQGINGFYDGVAQRQACCAVRKVALLDKVLAGASGWITGLRADQSTARSAADLVAYDNARGLLKLNPLIGWSREDAVRFTTAHQVPVNALHAQGFLSIGCAPCTRAVQPGELERAGRWWWEDEQKKECGLHLRTEGTEPLATARAAR